MAETESNVTRDKLEQSDGNNKRRTNVTIIDHGNATKSADTNGAGTVKGPGESARQSGRLIVEESSRNNDNKPKQTVKTPPQFSSAQVAASVAREKLTPDVAKSTANTLLSLIEIGAVSFTGLEAAQFSSFERSMILPPLSRRLEALSLGTANKIGPWLDWAFVVAGLAIYMRRLGTMQAARAQTTVQKGANTDTAAPVPAPVAQTVSSTSAGDKDGLAVPVPTILSDYMNTPLNGLAS